VKYSLCSVHDHGSNLVQNLRRQEGQLGGIWAGYGASQLAGHVGLLACWHPSSLYKYVIVSAVVMPEVLWWRPVLSKSKGQGWACIGVRPQSARLNVPLAECGLVGCSVWLVGGGPDCLGRSIMVICGDLPPTKREAKGLFLNPPPPSLAVHSILSVQIC
jgi:hypothetical protein